MTKDTQDDIVSDVAVQYKPKDESLPFEKGKLYTYSDYCTWDDDKRYELIDGVPYAMAAPSWKHQEIIVELARQLGNYLTDKPCKVFVAPFDVRLNADTADNTVVQPDVLIVCDRSKLNNAGLTGAPDMAVEVLSPGSQKMDRFIKLRQYEMYGVREYWIADPGADLIHVHELKNGRYFVTAYSFNDSIPVGIFDDCIIKLPEDMLTNPSLSDK